MGHWLGRGIPSRRGLLLCVHGARLTGAEPTQRLPACLTVPHGPVGQASFNPTKSCRSSGLSVIARDGDTKDAGSGLLLARRLSIVPTSVLKFPFSFFYFMVSCHTGWLLTFCVAGDGPVVLPPPGSSVSGPPGCIPLGCLKFMSL